MSEELDLGIRALSAGDAAAAVRHLERACQEGPGDYRAHLWLGAAYGGCNRPDDAVHALRKARDLQPSAPHVQYSLGIALQRAGHADGAAAAFEAAVALRPDYARARDALDEIRAAGAHGNGRAPAPPVRPLPQVERTAANPAPAGRPIPPPLPPGEAGRAGDASASTTAPAWLQRAAARAQGTLGRPQPAAPSEAPGETNPEHVSSRLQRASRQPAADSAALAASAPGMTQPAWSHALAGQGSRPGAPVADRIPPLAGTAPAAATTAPPAPATDPTSLAAEPPAESANGTLPGGAAEYRAAAPPPAALSLEESAESAPERPRGRRRGLILTIATVGCLALGWTATRSARPPDASSLPTAGAGPQLASASPEAPAPPAAAPDPARVERAQQEADAAADLLATVRARLDRARQGGATLGLVEIPALKRRCAEALRHFDRAFELDPGDRETLALRDRVSRSLGEIEAAEAALAQAAAARRAESARLAEQAGGLVDQVSSRIVAWERLPNSPPLSRAEAAALAQKCRDALRLADRAIGLERTNKRAWMQRVRAYRLLEDYPRMSEAMAQALALFRNDPQLLSLKDRLLPVAQP